MAGFEPGPGILPGVEGVRRDPEIFRKLIGFDMKYASRSMVGVKAFNEWGHQIEPATEYGFTYSQIVRDCVTKLQHLPRYQACSRVSSKGVLLVELSTLRVYLGAKTQCECSLNSGRR